METAVDHRLRNALGRKVPPFSDRTLSEATRLLRAIGYRPLIMEWISPVDQVT